MCFLWWIDGIKVNAPDPAQVLQEFERAEFGGLSGFGLGVVVDREEDGRHDNEKFMGGVMCGSECSLARQFRRRRGPRLQLLVNKG